MGACLSSTFPGDDNSGKKGHPQTAKVISIHGDLREYNLPASVSQVLQAEIAVSSSSSSSSSWFLCNSDHLLYDEFIPVLDSEAPLFPNQIYFVMPRSKLQHKMTAPDMAALAVKASLALQNSSKNKGSRRGKKTRISPVLLVNNDQERINVVANTSSSDHVKPSPWPMPRQQQQLVQPSIGFSRSGSVRRLQKYTSKRAKLAVRSFRLRLTTIHEGTTL